MRIYIAFAGIPGEPFQKIGMDIKATSPAAITFVTSCTNGGEENAYYPTKEAYDANGYEKSASIFAPGCAEKMIDGVISLLKSI